MKAMRRTDPSAHPKSDTSSSSSSSSPSPKAEWTAAAAAAAAAALKNVRGQSENIFKIYEAPPATDALVAPHCLLFPKQ
jgi:hypothetical protein